VLAYCHIAAGGEELFGRLLQRMNRNLLADRDVLFLYSTLCDRLHKSDELASLKPWLEAARARVFAE